MTVSTNTVYNVESDVLEEAGKMYVHLFFCPSALTHSTLGRYYNYHIKYYPLKFNNIFQLCQQKEL